MKLSVIVVTYQRPELLNNCLASIYAQQNLPPYEVIVVDNGGDSDILAPTDEHIHLHVDQPDQNLGVAGGRNRGMAIAQGDCLVCIDDDATWHTPHDVNHLIQILDAYPACGAIAVKSLYPNTNRSIIGELPHPNKSYLASQTQPIEIPYFYGMGHALRAEAVRKVGDYPARYFYAMEEIDLSWRLIDSNYRILYLPSVAVYHHKSEQGRPRNNIEFWQRSALNKCRVAWRLLPHPYPFTTWLVWSVWVLFKTRTPLTVVRFWHDLWAERQQLRQERQPIRSETVHYLRQIGGRFLY